MNALTPPKALADAIRHLLYPLVRFMLSRGVTYPFFAEMLKGIFVDVAEREFKLGGKAQTDSRISLLTGVHRKDVRRLRPIVAGEAEHMPQAVSLGAQLVAAWLSLPRFTDGAGHALPLARLARNGGEPSFEGLVASVSKDIRSRVVLDEWLRLGVVRLDAADRVILQTEAFVPQKGFDEMLFYLGHNLHDHAAAAVHNVLGESPPFLERSVHYDALQPGSVAELATLADKLGGQALLALNRQAMALEQRNAGAAVPARRITFGVYFYSEPTQPEASPAPERGAPRPTS